MSTHVILLLCLSFGASLRVFQFMTALSWLLHTTKERIPEILIQPDAEALVRRVRRWVRWAGNAVADALGPPAPAGA